MSLTTGAPLKNATVHLEMTGRVPAGHAVTHYTTTSNADGRFVFDSMVAATYLLEAERVGYIEQRLGSRQSSTSAGTLLQVREDEPLNDIVIKLTPQGLIAGRVVDEDGDPVPDATVEVLRRDYVNGVRGISTVHDAVTLQADGGFAIGSLKAGRYYVRGADRNHEQDHTESGRRGTAKEAFVPTYFPSGLDIATAAPIDLAPGIEIRGIDICLKKSRVFRVSGQVAVAKAAAGLLKELELNLTQSDGPPEGPVAEIENGWFEFQNVLPGTYVLRPDYGGKPPPLRGSTTVTVGDKDVTDVVLELAPPLEIAGQVTFQAKTPPELVGLVSHCRAYLEREGRSHDPYDAETTHTNQDGSFVVHASPGKYRVGTAFTLIDAYVTSIRLNGQELDRRGVDFTAGVPYRLEIVMSMNGAHIGGTVHDAEAHPVLHPTVQVCDAYDECVTQEGFPFMAFAPGEYRVFAWANEGEGVITSTEFRKHFESQSVRVKLDEKSRENVELTLITGEAMQAEAAKLP